MNPFQRQVAEMALRILASSEDQLMNEPRALDDIEQVATQVLKTVAGLKARKTYLPGERSGAWRVFKPAS